MPMPNPDEQARLEAALGWIGLGMLVLLLVLIRATACQRLADSSSASPAPARRSLACDSWMALAKG